MVELTNAIVSAVVSAAVGSGVVKVWAGKAPGAGPRLSGLFGVTRERIRQIKERALIKLRDPASREADVRT